MAIVLDIDGTVSKFTQKAEKAKQELRGIKEGYDKVGQASKDAAGAATKGSASALAGSKKVGDELTKRQKQYQSLEDYLKRLEIGQKKATNTKDIKAYNAQIAKTKAAMLAVGTSGKTGFAAINAGATASKAVFGALRATIASTFAPLFAVTAAAQGIRQVINLVSEFEQGAADLSAITGAQGDDLELLKQSAVELGTETTISAGKTLEGYKLLASAKPELLENAALLASTTKEIATLAEASDGDLPKAITNVTDIMAKFGAEADQTNRFVNGLAAGSKQGSADVGQLAASFLVAGKEMSSSNVAFEEGIGLVELLAENGLKGSEAGTGLRNVLSKLSATEVLPKDAIDRLEAAGVDMEGLSDKTLSFTDRLRLLAPVQNDANALTALFGLENKSAAATLIEGVDRVDELTTAVTGTNTAYEQAALRTGTLRGETAKLVNTFQALIQGNGGGLTNFLAILVRFVREGLLFFRDALESVKPFLSDFAQSVSGLFQAIGKLLPAQEDAAGGATGWGQAVKIVTVPLKLLLTLVTTSINLVTRMANSFISSAKKSTILTTVFSKLSGFVKVLAQSFIDLPAVVAASIAGMEVYLTGFLDGLRNLASNASTLLRETFNFKKLITEGSGDLTQALKAIAVNPFKGVGAAAKKAFADSFKASKEEVKVEIETSVVSPAGTPDTGSSDLPETAAKFVDPAETKRKAEAAKKEAEKAQKDIAKARLDAMQDGLEKELALEEVRYTDLKARLDKYGIDSTEATYQHELNKLETKRRFLQQAADLDDLSGEERIAFFKKQTDAEIDALEQSLKAAGGGKILEAQAQQIALLRKNAAEEYLKNISALQTKELADAQAHEINLLELKRDEYDSQVAFEEAKEREILNIRLQYAQKQLDLLAKTKGADSDAALALQGTINSIKGDIAELDSISDGPTDFSIAKLFGIDPADPNNSKVLKGLETAFSSAISIYDEVNSRRLAGVEESIAASDAEISAIQSQIEEKEKSLETEEDLGRQGFANKQDDVRAEIQLLKEQQAAEKVERDKALAEKKKIQKQQAIIDTVTQGSSLITAAAQIFQSVAAIPFVGPIIGAGLVAAMLGSFVAAKAKVFSNIQKTKAEKGIFGIVKGRRHSQGGEDFPVEVESGEAYGVLSRGATRKYAPAYKAFTDAANKGDRLGMARVASMLGRGIGVKPEAADALAAQSAENDILGAELNASFSSEELLENNRLMRKMIDELTATKRQTSFTPKGRVERTGNSTRVVKNKGV